MQEAAELEAGPMTGEGMLQKRGHTAENTGRVEEEKRGEVQQYQR